MFSILDKFIELTIRNNYGTFLIADSDPKVDGMTPFEAYDMMFKHFIDISENGTVDKFVIPGNDFLQNYRGFIKSMETDLAFHFITGTNDVNTSNYLAVLLDDEVLTFDRDARRIDYAPANMYPGTEILKNMALCA